MKDETKTSSGTIPADQTPLDCFIKAAWPGARVIILIEREKDFTVLKSGDFSPTTMLGMIQAAEISARCDLIAQRTPLDQTPQPESDGVSEANAQQNNVSEDKNG